MTDQREQPHIVERFQIGNTKISIADNYCLDRVKDKDKIDAILRRCADIALNSWAMCRHRPQLVGGRNFKKTERKGTTGKMNENPCKQCKNWCSCPERSRGMLCTAYIKYNPYYREDKRKESKNHGKS